MGERVRVTTDELVITQSTIKAYNHCARCWYLGHYLKLVKRDDYGSATTIGNLVHDALADHYAGGAHPVDHVRDAATAAIEADEFGHAQDIADDAELAGIMVAGYIEHVEETGVDYELKVIEPERMMRAQLLPARGEYGTVILLGKLDGRAETRDGTRRFLEHKTVSNFTDLPRFAPTEPQYLTYELLEYLEQLARGDDAQRTDGCILNMLKKVKRTARAKPPFYERFDVRHNTEELRNHWRHTAATARAMQRTIARLDAGEDFHDVCPPSAPTRECLYMCSFTELCVSGIMDDGSMWQGMAEALYVQGDPLARYSDDTVAVG